MTFDAVILAGGRATRLGGTPKPGVVVAGTTLLDRALAATRDARRAVVVAPDDGPHLPPGTLRTREHPPFGGPVAGIDAGLRALEGPGAAPHVLLLAVDVPRAGAAVPALAAAVGTNPGADGAYLVRDGAAQWLLGLYRRDALRRALAAVRDDAGSVHGAPVRRLVGHLECVEIDDDAGLTQDVDTWDDVARLEKEGMS
jgi:molybdopterin-guanine dinucleotide biosynthesis protein A